MCVHKCLILEKFKDRSLSGEASQELEQGSRKPSVTEAALSGAFNGVSAYLCISVPYSHNCKCALSIMATPDYVTTVPVSSHLSLDRLKSNSDLICLIYLFHSVRPQS